MSTLRLPGINARACSGFEPLIARETDPHCFLQRSHLPLEIDYKGIKVNECSDCEGVWFDAGELDAISSFEKTNLDKLFSVFKK